jgi:cyclohexanone monooxygenase
MASPDPNVHDAIVIGAGFAGLYATYVMRDRQNLDVITFDAGGDVGGTWYWNCYPGARVDIENVHYSYSFDPELQQDWHWTERFCSQPEIQSYLSHVADRYDLRRSIRFNSRVTSLTWDEAVSQWAATIDNGQTHHARYVISGAGTLSIPKESEFPGLEKFAGELLMTAAWPHHEISFAGKRVGVVGVGSSGIQLISELAKTAGHLTVLQRTPNYATPIGNSPTDPAQEAAEKADYREIREASRRHFIGVPYNDVQPSALAVTPEERRRVFDDRWSKGGFRLFIDSFADLLFDQEANDTAAEYVRDRIRERVKDPEIADLLTPTDHPYGTKRPPLETDYYEAFNRPNVELVDVRTNSIESVTERGVRLADGTEHSFDVLVLATGFDACTGPLLAMNITGRDGLRLADHWSEGPQTYLGLMSSGFPNLFMVTGPQSPSVLYNMPLAIEDHVDFAAAAIEHLSSNKLGVIEATRSAEQEWVDHTNQLATATLLPKASNSWYMGRNIAGKPQRVLVYLGGAPAYRARCDEVVVGGYQGFVLSAAAG